MMERMIKNKEKHSEGSRKRERNCEDFHLNEEFLESSHDNHDLYQPPPRQYSSRYNHHREPKLDLPPFFGEESVDDYLDWEMKVE